jgi:DNA-binding Lrp family transcriptional regulator
MRARLDATDWRILKELQADGRITNVALAARVGITPPPCLRLSTRQASLPHCP